MKAIKSQCCQWWNIECWPGFVMSHIMTLKRILHRTVEDNREEKGRKKRKFWNHNIIEWTYLSGSWDTCGYFKSTLMQIVKDRDQWWEFWLLMFPSWHPYYPFSGIRWWFNGRFILHQSSNITLAQITCIISMHQEVKERCQYNSSESIFKEKMPV